jgi:hypothetical protein
VGAGQSPAQRSGALQGVNFKTVSWTVLKEGTLCKRERPLKNYLIVTFSTERRQFLKMKLPFLF